MKTFVTVLLASWALAVGAPGSAAPPPVKCLGESVTITGTPGDDTITATDDDDVIAGLGGNDTIVGGGGFDVICGGEGNDTITQTSGGLFGAAVIAGGAGDDTIQGGQDTLVAADYEEAPAGVSVDLTTGKATGGDGNDTIVNADFVYGSAFDDTLTGNNNENVLAGYGGNDTIAGLGRADLIGTESGNDTVDGGKGIDEIYFGDSPKGVHVRLAKHTASGDGNDTLKSIENVIGSRHADVIVGTAAPNRVDAGPGNDRLYGLAGRDKLYGRTGKDFVDGGPGRDVCGAERTKHCP